MFVWRPAVRSVRFQWISIHEIESAGALHWPKMIFRNAPVANIALISNELSFRVRIVGISGYKYDILHSCSCSMQFENNFCFVTFWHNRIVVLGRESQQFLKCNSRRALNFTISVQKVSHFTSIVYWMVRLSALIVLLEVGRIILVWCRVVAPLWLWLP